MNAVMAGVLYFLRTAFGATSAVVGGDVISSIVTNKPLPSLGLLDLVANNSSQITGGSFLILLVGISLVAMTIFLTPSSEKVAKNLRRVCCFFTGHLKVPMIWFRQ